MSLELTGDPPVPPWLITHSYEDRDAGVLKSGKEAEVFLVERVADDGSSHLLAHKRYRPRYPKKGELEALGFSKGTIYRADAVYQAGWGLKPRERRALEQGSKFGHELAKGMWPALEFGTLERAWRAGACVPYPVEQTEDGILMEYVGNRAGAAPRLANAGLSFEQARDARDQLLDTLRALSGERIVHGDLSAYNMLWWEGRLVVIDFPQAVDAFANPHAPDLLHRDLRNVHEWFTRQRAEF
ncbi:MAG: RIO1 family regulatory kinase/ATPase, partial [Chloroflexota bacterium]